MDPDEAEYLAEKQPIAIIPTFNCPEMHLVQGDYGPFRAGIPLVVPLWLGLKLRKQRSCQIQQPDWMTVEKLETIKESEKNSKNFTKMPSEHYIVEAKLLLDYGAEDIQNADEIRTIIKDIWDIRMAKLRNSVDLMVKNTDSYAALDHLTLMEINAIRPLLPHALDQIYRMKNTNPTGQQSQGNTTLFSTSHSTSSNSTSR